MTLGIKLNTEYWAQGKMLKAEFIIKEGFELYAVYKNGKEICTLNSEYAALARVHKELYGPKAKQYAEAKASFNYKDL